MFQQFSGIGVVAALLLAATFCIYRLLDLPHDSREPPLLKPRIPVIGHFIGLIRHGMTYYKLLSKQYGVQIFTVHFGNKCAYVATSTPWITAVHRHSKTISFDPVLDFFADKLAGMSTQSVKNYSENDTSPKLLRAMRPLLLPGPGSINLTTSVIRELNTCLDDLSATQSQAIDMAEWLREAIAHASTDAVYGPHNPLRDQSLMEDFYVFESSLMLFIFSIPHFLHKKSFESREKLATAFEKYFDNGYASSGSEMTQARLAIQQEDGHSNHDIGRAEASNLSGILANAIPVTFWMFFELYSKPELLVRAREEVEKVISMAGNDDKEDHLVFNGPDLKSHAPLLVSVFQEVLRTRANAAAIRILMEDTTITSPNAKGQKDSFLLRKGAIVQMPAETPHLETESWGQNAAEFDEQRFMSRNETVEEDTGSSGKKRNPASFRAFGGGDHICPGRHFAATEILCLISMIIYRYEATPTDAQGSAVKWKAPKYDTNKVASAIAYPDGQFHVALKRREHTKELRCRWIIPDGEATKGFKLVIG